jgi:hypothetical protein
MKERVHGSPAHSKSRLGFPDFEDLNVCSLESIRARYSQYYATEILTTFADVE